MSGGPIGARVTMAASSLVMQHWGEEFKKILHSSRIPAPLVKGYVDDGRLVTLALRMGCRYDKSERCFKFSEGALVEDRVRASEGETKVARWARIALEAMNDINPDVQFTAETAEDFVSGWLPTLDLDLKMVKDCISHTYYQKPMRTPLLVMENSAMGSQQKNNIMSNEVMRRLFNVGKNQPMAEKVRILDQAAQQLKNSGYSQSQAANMILSGIRGDKRRRARREFKGEELYRKGPSTLQSMNQKKQTQRGSEIRKRMSLTRSGKMAM